MSFLPSPPRAGAESAEDLPQPPVVEANTYLSQAPPILLAANTSLPRKTNADSLLFRAEQSFERGKRLYQANDIAGARREFDAAIDSILEASAENPSESMDYSRRLDQMADAIHRFDLAGMGASAAVEEGKFEKAPNEDILVMTFPVDPKLKDRVREQLAATVSQLPLTVNDTVLGYINYFSHRGHSTIVAATQRSGRYRPMIQRILDEEGIPQELIHLAQAESGFIPRAMSRKAAGGMWQFLAERGRQYGLMQTRYTDDRMDPEMATRAAARHLHDLYTEFGDWYLAIAAYNCGPGAVEKAVERTGYADFWQLRSLGVLPAETTNYVPIILAMTIMEKNAAEYGLDGIQMDAPVEYDTVEMTAPTSLALVSDIADVPLAELAELNPAVLKGIAPEKFALHVPKGSGSQLSATLAMVPPERRIDWRMHRVAAGETLAGIGKRYGVTASAIQSVNHLQSSEAMEGDQLVIPVAHVAAAPAHRTASRRPAHRTSAIHRTTHSASAAQPRKAPVMVASAR
ncbi:MAG TPA: transglycosylase SLT domain-containing protein [Bryobacteraceae bacterium]|jgi:membrane-bound lytic murein transglycosylase D|nr:transglycosylase SLT domain-containing protein [Bryobacteraceae bacterium]